MAGGGAAAPLDPIPTPAIPPHAAHHAAHHRQRSRLGLAAGGGVGGAATGGVSRPGDWERRVLREFATDLSARPEAIQPPQQQRQSLAQAGFLAPRRETSTGGGDRVRQPATGKRQRDASDGDDDSGDADALRARGRLDPERAAERKTLEDAYAADRERYNAELAAWEAEPARRHRQWAIGSCSLAIRHPRAWSLARARAQGLRTCASREKNQAPART